MLIPTCLVDEQGKTRTIFDDDAMRIDLGFGEGFRFMIHRTVTSWTDDEGEAHLGLVNPPYTISDFDTGYKVCTERTGKLCIEEAKRLIQKKGLEGVKEMIGVLLENDLPLNDPEKYMDYEDYYVHIEKMRTYGVESMWL